MNILKKKKIENATEKKKSKNAKGFNFIVPVKS